MSVKYDERLINLDVSAWEVVNTSTLSSDFLAIPTLYIIYIETSYVHQRNSSSANSTVVEEASPPDVWPGFPMRLHDDNCICL